MIVLDQVLATHEHALEVLRECMRVLVCGGRLIIADQEKYSYLSLSQCLAGLRVQKSGEQVPRFSYVSLVGWLKVLGFEIEDVEPVLIEQVGSDIHKHLRSVSKTLLAYRLPAASRYMVTAEKRESRLITPKGLSYRKLGSIRAVEANRIAKPQQRDDHS